MPLPIVFGGLALTGSKELPSVGTASGGNLAIEDDAAGRPMVRHSKAGQEDCRGVAWLRHGVRE